MKQQAGQRAVLFAKDAEVPRIFGAWFGSGLHLERKKFVLPLNHKINFLARGGTPVQDCGFIKVGTTPSKQITQNQILKVRSPVLRLTRNVHRERGIHVGYIASYSRCE